MVTYNTLSDKPEAQYSFALNDDTPYSKMPAVSEVLCLLANPCCLILKLEIQKNILP